MVHEQPWLRRNHSCLYQSSSYCPFTECYSSSMPFMKKFGAKRGFTSRKKKFPKRGQKVLTYRSAQGALPQKFITQHVYVADYSRTDTGGFNYQINIINIDRPEPTGDNMSVNGFDEMSAWYAQWRVNYCQLTLKVMNNDGQNGCNVTIVPRADDTAITTMLDIAQQPYAKWAMLSNGTGGKVMHTFRLGVNPNTLAGRTLRFDDPGLTSGAGTTGPTKNMRFNLRVENSSLPAGNTIVVFTTILKYYVTWYDRKIIPALDPLDIAMLGLKPLGIKPGKEEIEEKSPKRKNFVFRVIPVQQKLVLPARGRRILSDYQLACEADPTNKIGRAKDVSRDAIEFYY